MKVKITVGQRIQDNEQFMEQSRPLCGFIPIYGCNSQAYNHNNGSTCSDSLQLPGWQLQFPGPIFMKGLSQGLGLKLRLLSQISA